MWSPFLLMSHVQVAMDRMKKIKRQLSMTLRGGRGIDKTNGGPEPIGLHESGGGGGSDFGEAPIRVAAGELHPGRGPLSSAPGGSTLIILSSCPSFQMLPPSAFLRLLFSFSFPPLPCYPFPTHFVCTSFLDYIQAPGGGRVPCLFSCPKALSAFFLYSVVALSVTLGLPSQGSCQRLSPLTF